MRTSAAERRTPPKKNKVGRPPKQRRCIAGGYDYLNWCTNCIYGKKKNGKFKKPCDGPRRVPMLGDDWADNNRDGVQDESGIWASPTAPPMLVGRFLKKTFQNCRGEDEEFTGAVMGYDEPYFKVLYCDGDGEDMTKASSPSRPPRRRPTNCGVKFGTYDASSPCTCWKRTHRCAS